MGNTSSSTKSTESRVDHGFLTPHGIYTGPIDWNQHTVANLILERRLAPFYRPLEEYDPTWDDETILANRKGPEPEHEQAANDAGGGSSRHGKSHGSKNNSKDAVKPTEAQIYRDAVECPICFMYNPPNINYSRCCFQAICTECFVQIKRNEPTPTHLVSEPACCPYCQQENFGITYTPPPWRTGLVSDSIRPELLKSSSSASDNSSRRKSLSADNPNVVTVDQIRPDWEERLAAVKAAVARRANRRIIMRQVGDRLIPVGVTSSRTQLPEGITTVEDIEELMLMEAMRLSLLEAERASNNNNPNPSTSAPAPSNLLIPARTSTPRSSASVSTSAPTRPSDDLQRRQGPLVSALTSPLANASRLIAVTTAMPSRNSGDVGTPSPQGLAPPAEGSQTSTDSQRRGDPTLPPTTTLAAAISAHSIGSAILQQQQNTDTVPTGSASVSPSDSSAEPVTTAPSSSHEEPSSVVPHEQDASTNGDISRARDSADTDHRKDVATVVHVEEGDSAVSH